VSKFRILSFDGGGIRGVLSTIVVKRLVAESRRKDLVDRTALFAGTSTGALIALGLAAGLPLAEVENLYLTHAPRIFADKFLNHLRDVGNFFGAQYRNEPLRDMLLSLFGDLTLGELKRWVMIPAFDLDNAEARSPGEPRRWKAKIFHNLPNHEADLSALIRNVGLYACSAPTYFPIADGYIDGGVYANNPSVCALAQALDSRWQRHPKLRQIVLLSIGSGQRHIYVPVRDANWGVAQWGSRIVPVLMESTQETADFQCRQILGDRQYHRVQPIFDGDFRMDDVRQVTHVIRFATDQLDLGPAIAWIHRHW
jgi:patatin-like phospholipase/acyl hydrolase